MELLTSEAIEGTRASDLAFAESEPRIGMLSMKTESGLLTKQGLADAMTSPVSVFDFPLEVVACPGLSRAQKIEILKRWELDARALQRATDENMSGGEPPLLDEVNRALMMLDPVNSVPDGFGSAPTKI